MARKKTTPVSPQTSPQPEFDVSKLTGTRGIPLTNERFRISDRYKSFESYLRTGVGKSIGASCNTFSVGDSIDSIAEATSWGLYVSSYQGAPSWDISQLRPRNSAIASGGTSSGAASFSNVFDSVVGSMRRETKKNGAGIVYIDAFHPDLEEFLGLTFDYAYKAVYVPGNHDRDNQLELLESPIASRLVTAYENNQAFIVKRPKPTEHGELLCNLCVEVEIPNRGTCVLGVINLAQYTPDNIHLLASDFYSASIEMHEAMLKVLNNLRNTPLYCNSPDNRQFLLGLSGLASMLGIWGISYENFNKALSYALTNADSIWQAYERSTTIENEKERLLISNLLFAYTDATSFLRGKVRAAFGIQPSATGAYDCSDALGFHSSAEIQPVIGVRYPEYVRGARKSALLGDMDVYWNPGTATVEDVPYEVYRETCCLFQSLFDLTGLAHRHSACFYGNEPFTLDSLETFMVSPQRSLYYRLPKTNQYAVDKSNIGIDASDLFEDVSDLGLASCGISQLPGSTECDCAA